MKPAFENVFHKASDSYESAEILFSHQRYSGVINRCYYAMFYVISALVQEKLNKHFKTHSGLIKIFNQEFVKSQIVPDSLFKSFKKVFEKRQVADYDMDSSTPMEIAKNILDETKIFLDSMREITDKL